MCEGADRRDAAGRRARQRHGRRDRSAMSKDEKTEHMPAHEATLIRPVPQAAPAPTEAMPPPIDPDATIRTTREQVADTAARTLQAAAPTSQSAYAQTLQSAGPAAYAPTLQSPPLTGPEGTKVMGNRLVGSLEDAGEGHHGPLEPGTIIKKRFVLETLLGQGGMGIVFGAIDSRKEEERDPN